MNSSGGTSFLVFLALLIVIGIFVAFGMLSSNEARKQRRSETAWFWIGVFFNINAFIALKISKAADDESHDITLWSWLGVLFGVTAIIAFESGLNAENKQHDFDCWCILGFCCGLMALLVSCFLKPFENPVKIQKQKTGWKCKKCGCENPESAMFCKICSSHKANQ